MFGHGLKTVVEIASKNIIIGNLRRVKMGLRPKSLANGFNEYFTIKL